MGEKKPDSRCGCCPSRECVRSQPIVIRRQQCGEARRCANYFDISRESTRENECTLIEQDKNLHRFRRKLRCTLIHIGRAGQIGEAVVGRRSRLTQIKTCVIDRDRDPALHRASWAEARAAISDRPDRR